MDTTNYVINLGRQLGSGGRQIAKRIAADLGIAYYDNKLIELAAEQSGLCKEFFQKADEKASHSVLGGIFSSRFPYLTSGGFAYDSYLSNDSLFKIQSDVIRNLAEQQSCLFVGRCADYILRDHPRSCNIFISSPIEVRTKRVMEYEGISEKEAIAMIEKGDKHRASYYNYYSFKKWGEAGTYHLCIDSSILGIEETTTFIETFIKRKLNLL